MKIELIKKEGADGIWHHIEQDGWCIYARRGEREARAEYERIINLPNLTKKVTVLESFETT